jgi:hypothetical protein
MIYIWLAIGIIVVILVVMVTIIINECQQHKPQVSPHLVFQVSIHYKNFNYMTIISSLNLTSIAPVVLTLSVVDQNNANAVIPGTLSAITLTPADPTQDVALADATVPNGVDVHAVSDTGGTTVTATAAFTSTALKADGTPVVTGTFTATLTIANNIVVAAVNPLLVFNQ